MAANAELTSDEIRGKLRLLARAEQRFAVFVYFCRYYKPDTDQGPPQAEIAAATGLAQSTISGYIRAAHEALEIPYPLRDGRGLSGAEIRRRVELLKQYQAVIIADKTFETLSLKNADTSNSEPASTSAAPVAVPVPPDATRTPTPAPIASEPPPITPLDTPTASPSTSINEEQTGPAVPPHNPIDPMSEPIQARRFMRNIFDRVREGNPPPQPPRPRNVPLIVAGLIGGIALVVGLAVGSLGRQGGREIVVQTVMAPETVEVPVTREVAIEVTRRVIETFVVERTVEVTLPPQIIVQVVTATPEPATSTPEIPPTPAPTLTATPAPVPLVLPFTDSFDSGDAGRRPEWQLISGDHSSVAGKLTIVSGPLILELPSAGDVKDYTVSFDYDYSSYAHFEVYFGPQIRFVFDSHAGGTGCYLQAMADTSWATKASLPCLAYNRAGNVAIKLSGSNYTLLANNVKIGDAIFAVNAPRQPIQLVVTNEGGTTIDNFKVTSP